MSASDWEVCPRCLDRAQAERATKQADAVEAYGKVTPEAYEAMCLAAAAPIEQDKMVTFREDYEFYGVADGVIHASYSGHCSVCGLGLDFADEHPFYSRGTNP